MKRRELITLSAVWQPLGRSPPARSSRRAFAARSRKPTAA